MDSGIDKLQEAYDIYNRMPFGEKCRTTIGLRELSNFMSPGAIAISIDGFVRAKDKYAVTETGGEAYVYLWKHIDGDVFYVGSGVGERWKQKYRGEQFYKEIDKGDAVVYKVLDGVDRATAFFYERYISCSLSEAGFPLCNADNLVLSDKSAERFKDWKSANEQELNSERCKAVESVILNSVLSDTDFVWTVHRDMKRFLEEYGEHYFTEHYS